MIERLIRAALAQRLIVLLVVLGLIVSGVAAFRHLPIDAFPDVTPVQVQVITRAPSLAPAEIERLVTFPLEIELTNLPGKTELRSVSRFGLSVITVVFEDKMDIYFARQLVLERMLQARSRLPAKRRAGARTGQYGIERSLYVSRRGLDTDPHGLADPSRLGHPSDAARRPRSRGCRYVGRPGEAV